MQRCRVPLVCAIEIVCRLLAIIFVVFGKATIEENVRRIIDGQALPKFVIFPQIQVAVHGRAVDFDLRVDVSGSSSLGDGLGRADNGA